MELNKCGRDGCNPVEQSRGQMKPEDHFEQFRRHKAAVLFSDEHGVVLPLKAWEADAHNVEDLGPDNASDVRVACSRCGKASGWDRRDTEATKRHGDGDHRRHTVTRDGNMDAVRTRWNEMVK